MLGHLLCKMRQRVSNQSAHDRIVLAVSMKSSPGFRSMKSTMLSPSLTAPKSSTTRAESRALHVFTSSLLKRFSGTSDQTTTETEILCLKPSKQIYRAGGIYVAFLLFLQHTESPFVCLEHRTHRRRSRSVCGGEHNTPDPPCTGNSWAEVASREGNHQLQE